MALDCSGVDQSEFISIMVELKEEVEMLANLFKEVDRAIYQGRGVMAETLPPFDEDFIAWEDLKKEVENSYSLLEDYIRCYENEYGPVPISCVPRTEFI